MRNEICIGIDLYNQSVTGGVSKTLSVGKCGDEIPLVLIFDSRGNGGGAFLRPLREITKTE